MHFTELTSFQVAHRHLAWPWIAIHGAVYAFATGDDRVTTRIYDGPRKEPRAGTNFTLPAGLTLPANATTAATHHGAEAGLHAFAPNAEGTLLAIVGTHEGASLVVTLNADGERARTRLDALTGDAFIAHAVAFDRSGRRLWISAETASESALILIDASTHALVGIVKGAPFPPPATHEFHVHPTDDAVLLLAACGEDGTFARVAGWSDGPPEAIATPLDKGGAPAGFVGFSVDGVRVHLVEEGALRTHAWPGLEELSSVPLATDFVSSFTGAVLGHRILIDGEHEDGDDAVMLYDRSAIRGALAKDPVPHGMWVGALASDAIVTVDAKGEPSEARVFYLPTPGN